MTIDEFCAWLEKKSEWDGDCLIWKGAVSSGPILPIARIGGSKSQSVKRAMLKLKGLDMKGKFAVSSCGNPRCVAEEHVQAMTRGATQVFHWEVTGRAKTAKVLAARARTAQEKSTLCHADIATIRTLRSQGTLLREIRDDHFPSVSISTISRICLMQSWSDSTDPFRQLRAFAANDSERRRA
jgi:hypothetical protein